MRSRPLFIHGIGVALAAMAAGVMAPSCIYDYPDPDCIDDVTTGSVSVTIDWAQAPDADPEGMTTLFYPVSGGDYYQYEFAPAGGKARLADGFYDVACVNNDTGATLFEGQDSYASLLVSTRTARLTDGLSLDYPYSQPPRAAGEGTQPVVNAPDPLWGIGTEGLAVTGGTGEVTLRPVPLTCRYRVELYDVVNIESASQVSMAISGLAAGRYVSTAEPIAVSVAVPGSLRRTDVAILSGQMLNFGRHRDPVSCLLSVYVLLKDGERLLFRYDVTDLVDSAPDPHDVTVRLKGPELPAVQSAPGAGLDVGVDDWDIIEIELST